MSDAYTHEKWIAGLTVHTKLVEGDERALAAIRQATRDHYHVEDVTEDAPVYFWMGGHVKGLGEMSYQIPADAAKRYLAPQEFPRMPIAVWPDDDGSTRRDELYENSRTAEGDPLGIAEVLNRTRLYHEVPEAIFPTADGDLRWFANGLHVVGPGDDPAVFQTPMARVDELIVPRQAPTLPWIKAPPRAG